VLRSFTARSRRDLDAVVAGLTPHDNSGASKAPVNRIKKLKTAMYGRGETRPSAQADTPGLNTAPDFRDNVTSR